MNRLHTETATFGWLNPPDGSSDTRSSAEVPRADNWPIPLVVRRQTPGWREISADWFEAAERNLYPSRNADAGLDDSEATGYQLVSRRRLRLAHALFTLLALALVALIAWEVHVYFGVGPSLEQLRDYFR